MGVFSKISGIFGKIKGAILASTATKAATAALAVVVIGGGAAGLAYAGVFTSAETAMERAHQAMQETEPPVYEEIFGWNALCAAMKEQGSEFGADVVLEELDASSFGLTGMKFPNVGVELVSRADKDAKMNLDLGLKMAGTTLLSGKVYADEAQVQAAVPKLFSSVLTLNCGSKSFKEDVLNSYLVNMLGIDKAELEKNWESVPEDFNVVRFLTEYGEALRKLAEVYVTLSEGTEYEKAGKQEITAGNETLKCKVYTATVANEAVAGAMDVVLPMLKDFMKGIYVGQSVEDAVLSGTYEAFEGKYLEYYKKIQDVQVSIYVYDDRIAKQEITFSVEDENGSLDIWYAMTGNPYDNMEFVLNLPVPEREALVVEYAIVTTVMDDVFATVVSMTVDGVELLMDAAYETLSGEFKFCAGAGAYSLALNGVVDELEIGKKISVELEQAIVKDGEAAKNIPLDVALYLKVLEENVATLSGEQKDVLQMTEEDFNALGEEITGNVYEMIFGMFGLFQ